MILSRFLPSSSLPSSFFHPLDQFLRFIHEYYRIKIWSSCVLRFIDTLPFLFVSKLSHNSLLFSKRRNQPLSSFSRVFTEVLSIVLPIARSRYLLTREDPWHDRLSTSNGPKITTRGLRCSSSFLLVLG